MSKIKHDEAISILQMILTFLHGIIEMCRKKNVNDNDNDNDNVNVNQ